MALSLVFKIANFPCVCNTANTGKMVIKQIAKVERISHSRMALNFVEKIFYDTLYESKVRVNVEHVDFVLYAFSRCA